jgi:hypothetical protein
MKLFNSQKDIYLKLPVLAFVSGFILSSTNLKAQGDLMIYPKRLLFDGSKRSQELNLVNNGHDTARYVISVLQIRMKEDGSFETIVQPEDGQYFADKNFRFFPRNVVLGPKEAQTVKIQLVQYSKLTPGEYRSHLYFRAEQEKKPLEKESSDPASGALAIRIVPIYGISIPVLIRTGESTTEISLSKISFQFENDSLPILKMNLNRKGNMSVYGDITIDYISREGKEIPVAMVKGLAVYTPNITRQIQVPLKKQAGIDYHKGALHIVFIDRSGPVEKVAQEQIFLN